MFTFLPRCFSGTCSLKKMSCAVSLRRGLRLLWTPAIRKISFVNNIRSVHVIASTQHILLPRLCESNLQIYRLKSKKTRRVEDDSDSDESDDENVEEKVDAEVMPGSKHVVWKIPSSRIDRLLNRGHYGRKDIELAFYDGRILVNGKKLTKKSAEALEGDVIDYVRNPVLDNPAFLEVDRIEVLALTHRDGGVTVQCSYSKKLRIKASQDED